MQSQANPARSWYTIDSSYRVYLAGAISVLPRAYLNSIQERTAGRSGAQPPTKTAALLQQSLKIGDIARLLGVSPSLVRAWEKMGIASPARTDSRYRVYRDGDIRALRRAVYLRRMQGLNAPAILRQLREEGLLNGSEPKSPPALPPLGPKLRTMRMERGKSLAEVAEAVGVSAGYLSNVERTQNEPSLSVLHRLAQYYGLDLSDLFGAVSGTTPLVRPHDRKVLLRGHGVTMELLASGKVTMEPHLFRIAPGAGSGDTYTHQGEEFLFVVKGCLTITLEDQAYPLRTGDSFYFGSHLPHRWINSGKTETIVLWVNTPPAY